MGPTFTYTDREMKFKKGFFLSWKTFSEFWTFSIFFSPKFPIFSAWKIFKASFLTVSKTFFYHEDLEKRGACGVVAHERPESHVAIGSLLTERDILSKLSAFQDLDTMTKN